MAGHLIDALVGAAIIILLGAFAAGLIRPVVVGRRLARIWLVVGFLAVIGLVTGLAPPVADDSVDMPAAADALIVLIVIGSLVLALFLVIRALVLAWRERKAAGPKVGDDSFSSGDVLSFRYRDANGDVSERIIRNWDSDGEYIEGYCQTARAPRTFRVDRVIEYLRPEDAELGSPTAADQGKTRQAKRGMSILFTGFSKAERKELEELAEAAGLRPRTTVTQDLLVLCIGPRAGHNKIRAAEDVGASILSRDRFERMLETGEVPAPAGRP